MKGAAPAEPCDDAAEDAEVAALLERPMDGAIRLALARSPSPRASVEAEGGERYRRVLARDSRGALVGVGVRSLRRIWLDGTPAKAGYLSQLRVNARVGIRRWRAFFAELLADRAAGELPFDLTVIGDDNRPARRLLEHGGLGLPPYHLLGELVTLVFAAGPRRRLALTASPADEAGLASAVELLERIGRACRLAPRWSAEDLRVGELLVVRGSQGLRACGAIWDQRAFKQVRVAGYTRWLGALRPLVNLALGWRGEPRLPPAGRELALAYLAFFAASDAEAAAALVESACRRAQDRGLDQLALTLSSRDPWLAALRRARPARCYHGRLYAVGEPPADVEGWRGSLVQWEGATL